MVVTFTAIAGDIIKTRFFHGITGQMHLLLLRHACRRRLIVRHKCHQMVYWNQLGSSHWL